MHAMNFSQSQCSSHLCFLIMKLLSYETCLSLHTLESMQYIAFYTRKNDEKSHQRIRSNQVNFLPREVVLLLLINPPTSNMAKHHLQQLLHARIIGILCVKYVEREDILQLNVGTTSTIRFNLTIFLRPSQLCNLTLMWQTKNGLPTLVHLPI